MDNLSENQIESALKKRAFGYDSTEVTEEYSQGDDGGVRLIKRKVVSKNVPPDVSAVKLLMELQNEKPSFESMTDEELEKEKIRLIKILTAGK